MAHSTKPTPIVRIEDVWALIEHQSLERNAPDPVTLPLNASLGCVLAKPAMAAVSVPPFDRAMMDGFAIHAEDSETPMPLSVVGCIGAGEPPYTQTLERGQALRIMTGAPVPHGATAVARFEWCNMDVPEAVTVLKPVAQEESIQRAGADALAGTPLLKAGTRLTYTHLAILRTFGVSSVTVHPAPRVALLITGSEISENVEQPLQPGQIYGCNDLLLQGAIHATGGIVGDIQYVPDSLDLITTSLEELCRTYDVVITTGGVSAGDFDHVPTALRQAGAQVYVEKVWMRPGSPFVLATLGQSTVFGLSGSPAAGLSQFEVLVSPWFQQWFGESTNTFPLAGILQSDLHLKSIKHTRVLRAKATVSDGRFLVTPSPAQSPSLLANLSDANCLIRLDESDVESGTHVPLRWLPDGTVPGSRITH